MDWDPRHLFGQTYERGERMTSDAVTFWEDYPGQPGLYVLRKGRLVLRFWAVDADHVVRPVPADAALVLPLFGEPGTFDPLVLGGGHPWSAEPECAA